MIKMTMDPSNVQAVQSLGEQYDRYTVDPSTIRATLSPQERDLVKEYPSLIRFPIAWGDQDAFGHVNNIMYLRYFESGRAAYLAQMRKIGSSRAAAPERFEEYLRSNSPKGVIIKEISCVYRMPVTYPDTLTVGVRVPLCDGTLKRDRFVMQFVVVSSAHQAVVAHGRGTIVTFDYVKFTKMDIPDEFMSALLHFEALVGNLPPRGKSKL